MVRTYRPDDALRLEDIFRRAIQVIGAEVYSPRQVNAWSSARVTAGRLHQKYADGRATFIAVDASDRAIAFSDLEADGHIDMLYCDPDFARQGIATALLSAIEEKALRLKIERLYTEASEAAKPVFAKAGFDLLQRQDLEIDGVAIHNWAMQKRL